MVMEFAVGRASRKSAARSFHLLEPKGTKWHLYSYGAMLGNYMLMMFYTTVGGWMLAYFFKIASGTFTGLDTEAVGNVFNTMLSNPGRNDLLDGNRNCIRFWYLLHGTAERC